MSVETGLATILRTLPDPFAATGNLRVSEGWPDAINTDVAIIDGPTSYEDNDIAGCRVAQNWDIVLLFSLAAGMSRARARVMDYLAPSGPKSIRAALYAAPTLGDEVQAFNWLGLLAPPGRVQIFGKGFQAEVPVDEYYGATIQLGVVL